MIHHRYELAQRQLLGTDGAQQDVAGITAFDAEGKRQAVAPDASVQALVGGVLQSQGQIDAGLATLGDNHAGATPQLSPFLDREASARLANLSITARMRGAGCGADGPVLGNRPQVLALASRKVTKRL